MDHQYGIAVTNRFALFGDEGDDPFDVISKINAAKKDAEKKPKNKVKNDGGGENKPAVQEKDGVKKKEGGDKPQLKQSSDRGRGGSAKNREPREIRENDGDKRPPRRQGPRENRDGKVGDENVPPEFRQRPEGGFKRRDDQEGGGFKRREDQDGGGFKRRDDQEGGVFKRRDDQEGGGFGGERGRGFGGERGRGRGRGRGARGGERGGDRGGFGPRGDRKREFDRHSGNGAGIKPVEKKEGSGAHNWGSFKDDIQEQGQVVAADESNDYANKQEKPELNESGEVANVDEEEVEAPQMSLDEWKALKTQGKAKPDFNIRQAGEGVDSAQWKSGVEYQKKPEEDEQEDSDYEEDDHSDHHNRKQLVTDIRITFNDNPRRGRGRRGGRGGMERGAGGGGRGARGGSSNRGFSSQKESAPCFDDEADFPSLLKAA